MFLLFFLVRFVLAAAFSIFLQGWLLLRLDVRTVGLTLLMLDTKQSHWKKVCFVAKKLACASAKVKNTENVAWCLFNGAW